MQTHGFEMVRKLGEGAYSSVYKVHRASDSTDYAMKSIKMGNLSTKEQENAVNEVRFLASLSSPEIVAYKEAFYEEKTGILQIIMEYCAGGDLLNKTKNLKKKNQYLDEKVIWLYILQMTRGLRKLHEFNIVHRDFKCANVMLNREHTQLKLGDLNVSKVAKHGGLLYTQTGTPYYASPEIWRDKPYNSKSDVWSLGCVIYELVTLSPPFKANDMEGLYKKVQKGVYDAIPTWYSSDLSDFIALCLQVNPRSRPTTAELLDTPLLQKRVNIAQELNLKREDETVTIASTKQDLLKTLKIGKNLSFLNSILPEPQYDSTAASTPERGGVNLAQSDAKLQSQHNQAQQMPSPTNNQQIAVTDRQAARNSILIVKDSDNIKKPVLRQIKNLQSVVQQQPTNVVATPYGLQQHKRQLSRVSHSQSMIPSPIIHSKSVVQTESDLDTIEKGNKAQIPVHCVKVHRSKSIESVYQLKAVSNPQSPHPKNNVKSQEQTPILPPINASRISSLMIKEISSSNIINQSQLLRNERVTSSRVPNYLKNYDQALSDITTPTRQVARNSSQGAIPQVNLPYMPVSARQRASEVLLLGARKGV